MLEAVPFCGQIVDGCHQLLVRVYYADTDFSGVVYHGRYLEFFERGRTEFLRLSDIRHSEIIEESLAWVVRRMDIEFYNAARMDDILMVESRVVQITGARITMEQFIKRGDRLLTKARVEVAVINHEGKPRRFPDSWRDKFVLPTKL